MRLRIKQDKRELFEASFSIMLDEESIGGMSFRGKVGTPESEISITLGENNISLKRKNKPEKKGLDAYRPYNITKDGIEAGEVFQASKKTGLFKSYGYQYACIDSVEYSMFPIGFGEQGSKNPVYMGNTQISLIKKDVFIIDDMHDFNVIVRKDDDIEPTVIFIAYIFAKSFFKPGDLIKKGKVKAVTTTTEKELLDKYDESFEIIYG